MNTTFIFAVPSATQQRNRTNPRIARKRKRDIQDVNAAAVQQTPRSSQSDHSQSVEYTAIVTPAERSQRRLAGLSIDQDPPTFPFPHVRYESKSEDAGDNKSQNMGENNDKKLPIRISLHNQHLARMTAILHRCMTAKDYTRAQRVLGLLLRNEVGGNAIDIRHEGLWGIGAEILYRQTSNENAQNDSNHRENLHISREGFERAKLYYERLMVQYPLHKTWPDAINVLDFCIALFGLWVYVINQESLSMQEKICSKEATTMENVGISHLEAKKWELEQARHIADAMDIRMRDVPFNNDFELIRLRAMIALWMADTLDICTELEEEEQMDHPLAELGEEDFLSKNIESMVINQPHTPQSQPGVPEATYNRDLAQTLLRKIQYQNEGSVDDEDS